MFEAVYVLKFVYQLNKRLYKEYDYYFSIIIIFFFIFLCILYKNMEIILLKKTKIIKLPKKLLHIFHKNVMV